jgi:hypothetical protein
MASYYSDHHHVSFVVIVTTETFHVVVIRTMVKRFSASIIVTSVLFHRTTNGALITLLDLHTYIYIYIV